MTTHSAGRFPIHAAVVLVLFAVLSRLQSVVSLLPAYRGLYDLHPFYVPEGMRSAVEILLALLTVALLNKVGLLGALRELGWLHRPWPGLIFALLACFPLWTVFSLTLPVAHGLDPWAVLYLAVLSPLAEETVFRGFAYGQLRNIGWGFWPAAIVPAVVFGLVHLRAGQSAAAMAGVFAIAGIGGVLFSFVYERWDRSLWAPWGVHALMNLSWNVFALGHGPLAGWLPTAMQAVTAVVAVALCLWRPRLPLLGRSTA